MAQATVYSSVFTESGSRCFTIAALKALVYARVEAAGHSATVVDGLPLAGGVTIAGPRGERYEAGCAVLTDVRPADDGQNIVAVISKPRS